MRTININPTQQYTAVPNAFIDNYLPNANPTYSVIYLYFYRHCLSGARAITVADVAKTFDVLETDVVKCLKYWEKAELVRLKDAGDDCDIEFIMPSQSPVELIPADAPTEDEPPAVPASTLESPTVVASTPEKVIVETRPIYTVDELELYKAESEEVARLFSSAEQAFGKLLHYNDLNVLFGLYDWLRLPLDIIGKLLNYCAETGHLNMRYIEKVAIDWTERGISCVEDAEEYIRMFSGGYREIMNALGRGGRTPTPKEIKYMDKWLVEYAMPMPVVLEACDRTIMQTGKGAFAYCDKIIADWHTKGVAGLDDVNRVSEEFAALQAAPGETSPESGKQAEIGRQPSYKPSLAGRKPSRFANFTQREWDFNEIERVERAYLESCLTPATTDGKEYRNERFGI